MDSHGHGMSTPTSTPPPSSTTSVPDQPPPVSLEDVDQYLKAFRRKDQWKFNKRLQLKAIEHCYDLSDKSFKRFIRYIVDLKGGQRDRLLASAQKIFESEDESSISQVKRDRAHAIVQTLAC